MSIWKKITALGLKKLAGTKNLGTEVFENLIKVVPQIAIEALVVDNLDHPAKILLVWREDAHYRAWHITGGFIRFGEMPEDRLKQVIQNELGVGVKRYRDTGLKHTLIDARGHAIGLVYLVELENENVKEGQWHGKIPNVTIARHKELISQTLGWNQN